MELLVGLACVALVLVPLMLFQAMVLRFACQICGVEQPDYIWAIAILIINGIVTTIIQVAIFWVYTGGNFAAAQHNPNMTVVPNLIAFPVTLITSMGIYSSMLSTTLGRAFLILLVNFAVYMLLCCVPFLVMGGVGFVGK